MKKPLPTINSGGTEICDFFDALKESFAPRSQSTAVRMYFYGVTQSGWAKIRDQALAWVKAKNTRTITAFIGTDHGLTDPKALKNMISDGVVVHLLTEYDGTYHPKLVVFEAEDDLLLVSGSNNLTGSGLTSNIEFGSKIKVTNRSTVVRRWENAVAIASEALTNKLLNSYTAQRKKREKALKDSATPWAFTFKERRRSKHRKPSVVLTELPVPLQNGVLIYEVTPRETSTDGAQIQIRKAVATGYFGLRDKVGATRKFKLKNKITGEERDCKMTRFKNVTQRLSIHEASYSARPCFLLFERMSAARFEFVVISESENPIQYGALDERLGTRNGNQRRYEIVR